MANARGPRRPPRRKPAADAARRTPTRAPKRPPAPAPAPVDTGPLRLGAIPGATPGKWIDVWQERMPAQPLELVQLEVSDQRAALEDGTVDAAIVRLPIDREGLHVIPLYDELPVVVAAIDSHLLAADELALDDLAGEVLIVPVDDVLGSIAAETVAPRFAAPGTTADAIATAATGVGIVVVPMSLARQHHRKDVDYRVLREGPVSSVALAWSTERTTPAVETFIGIVRGRTANSSRD